MPAINAFYKKRKHFDTFLCHYAIEERSETAISCRVLEHLCTRYIVTLDGPALYKYKGRVVNLNEEYNTALSAHSKALFDCFRRGEKFSYTMHGHTVTTTVGQLYWFKWAIEHGVLKFAYRIRDDLELHAAAEKREQTKAKKKQRNDLKRKHPDVPALLLPRPRKQRRTRRRADPCAFTQDAVRIDVQYAQ